MAYWTMLSGFGAGVFALGCAKEIKVTAVVGLGVMLISMAINFFYEIELEDRIKKLEMKLREVKTNGKRNTL